jgi:N-acetylmuramoyl-L-alanine amidase
MKIAISSGHYANTGGKRTPKLPNSIDIDNDGSIDIQAGEQYREHYANTGVCYYLDIACKRCGFNTFKVGWNDKNGADDLQDISLSYRQVITAAEGCDLYISVHFNAIGDGTSFNTTEGVCTFYHSNPKKAKDSKNFATIIQKYLIQGSKQKSLGIRTAEFAECDAQIMNVKACALCELAFMTNLREATELMAKESFWIECAEEICQGVCEYTGVKYIEPIKEVINNEDDEEMIRYQRLSDIPNNYGFRDIINILMTAKIINGDGSDKEGNNDIIDLSHDQVRSLVFEYRGGAFDRKLIAEGKSPAVQV